MLKPAVPTRLTTVTSCAFTRAAARKSGQNVHTNCMGKASRGAA